MERMKRKTIFRKILLAALCVFLIQGLITPVWAATNKAAQITATFYQKNKEAHPVYGVSVDFKTTGKLAKKNYISGKFEIQKSLLKKTGDMFSIFPEVDCYKKNGVFAGTLYSKYMISIVKEKNKYTLYSTTQKWNYKNTKWATLKETSKELIITLNKLPLLYNDAGLNQKTTFYLSPTIQFLGDTSSKVTGTICMDRLNITAAKKHYITFNSSDYRYLHAMTEDGKPVAVKLVKK